MRNFVFLSILILFCSSTEAAEVAFRAHVDKDISLANAMASNKRLLPQIAACLEQQAKRSIDRIKSNEDDNRKNYDAWEKANNEAFERWRTEAQTKIAKGALPDEFRPEPEPSRIGTFLLPSVMERPCITSAAIERNECEEDEPSSYFWATADQLIDGTKSLELLLQRAKDGKPFDTANFEKTKKYSVIVEASESSPAEQHFARCDVRVVKGVAGPPHDCTTVAIVTSATTLLRRSNASPYCQALAHATLGGAIEVEFDVQTPREPTAFSVSIGKMLSQLSLSTEQVETKDDSGRVSSISFHSTAGVHNSSILTDGSREAMDFDISISKSQNAIDVYAKISPLVCRQASGNLVDYHNPSDAQKTVYANALNSLVEDAIGSSCKQFSKIDGKKLVCN